jgi:hypothetical protein
MAEANRDGDEVTLKLSVDEAILVQVMVGMTSTQRANDYQNRAGDVFQALEEVLDRSADEKRRWSQTFDASCDDGWQPTIRFTGEIDS